MKAPRNISALFSSSYGWALWLAVLALVNYFSQQFHGRIDLTEEKRFTLSEPSLRLLRHLKEPVQIDVLLNGDLPPGFRKLSSSVREMLLQFEDVSKGKVRFAFKSPIAGLGDSARALLMDSLQQLGLSPMNIKAQIKGGQGEVEDRYVFPGAVITYQDRITAVDFLKGQSSVNGINSLNNAEALLEYNFCSSIRKITEDSASVVGYMLGNGEPFSFDVYDLVERNLRKNYVFRFLYLDSIHAIPPVFNTIFVVKPTQKFTDLEKLKLDQYIMHGGHVIWMIDNLYADMDSLKRVQNNFVAFDRGLNLQDLLFKYGVRINLDLVQDLNCDKIPSVIGTVGGKPQIGLVPWYYSPLLSNYDGDHPISKNLDYVLSTFPNSIDTVMAPGIKKTALLSSSEASRLLNSPAIVSWNSVSREEDLKTFNRSYVPVAILLEGKFSSLYANRLSAVMRDSLGAAGESFLAQSATPGKMIVVSNGDIALNPVSAQDGPLQMGMNPYTKYTYANSEFVMNALEYLVDNSGILESRSKDYTLRLLDKKKLDEDGLRWQLTNVVLPLVLVAFFGLVIFLSRRLKYQR